MNLCGKGKARTKEAFAVFFLNNQIDGNSIYHNRAEMRGEWGWIRQRSRWSILLGHILFERMIGQLHGNVTRGNGTRKSGI